MRIILLANNWLGWKITDWLRRESADLAGLVLHPAARRKYGDETLESAGVRPEAVFDGATLGDEATLTRIADLRADLAVSVLFDYILRPPFLSLFPRGVINLHPALLPYNRGQYPNVWSIIDRTPAGVTIHRVDAGIDTGDILAQREVPVTSFDTGESLYRRLEQASLALFQEAWPQIRAGTLQPRPQEGAGTYHRTRDVDAVDEIELDRQCVAGDLLNLLRARTFPPYKGAYFRDGDRKVYVRVQLIPEDELEEPA